MLKIQTKKREDKHGKFMEKTGANKKMGKTNLVKINRVKIYIKLDWVAEYKKKVKNIFKMSLP